MKLLCAALLVLLGHQALTKPRRVEHQPSILKPGPVENPKGIHEADKGNPKVTTRKPWVIKPLNENTILLDSQSQRNRKMDQMLLKLKSMPVENLNDIFGMSLGIPEADKGNPKVTTGKPWVIKPLNANTVLLDNQIQLNQKMDQMLLKLKSMPVENLKGCKKGDFQCDSYLCVSEEKRCDGRVNCVDGTDEADCDQLDISQDKGKRESRQGINTDYACETKQLNIECDVGHVIKVTHANYGRTSKVLCIAGLPLEQITCPTSNDVCNCSSETSLQVVYDRCSGQISCNVPVNSVIFGDPCYGTYKYLEVDYACEPGCGGEISHTSGTFNHPNDGGNYQNYENCTWIIRAGQPIKITFTRFQVEDRYDFLIIRDGDNSGSSVLGELTGHTIPHSVETSGNAAYLQFTSDYSVNFNGFEIQWEPLGCGGEYTTSNGVISHPLNGGSYGNDENCIWKIKAEEPIKITFVRFGLEFNYDFLYLRDGESSASSLLGSFTGDNLPMSVKTNQNSAFIRFSSDYSVTSTGFELSWEPSPKVTTCQCGMANTERIIGGTEVNPKHKYPWQIGLKKPGYYIKCGGTIINDRWILTAAHCITDRETCRLNNDADLKVLVGEHNQFDGNDDTTDTTQYSIETFIKHHSYNCETLDYDFALLELTEAIPFNSFIRPICLPEDDSETYAGQTGIVTGWGLTADFTEQGTLSDFLNVVQVSIFANDDCKNWGTIAEMKICATVGICSGDSGGPMHVVKNGKYVQVGVVSYVVGFGCTATGYPGVYARVSKVLPWITTTTSNGKKCD